MLHSCQTADDAAVVDDVGDDDDDDDADYDLDYDDDVGRRPRQVRVQHSSSGDGGPGRLLSLEGSVYRVTGCRTADHAQKTTLIASLRHLDVTASKYSKFDNSVHRRTIY